MTVVSSIAGMYQARDLVGTMMTLFKRRMARLPTHFSSTLAMAGMPAPWLGAAQYFMVRNVSMVWLKAALACLAHGLPGG